MSEGCASGHREVVLWSGLVAVAGGVDGDGGDAVGAGVEVDG